MYTSYIDYFEATLQRCPDKTAVVEEGVKYDFKTTAENARKLATAIIGKVGETRNEPIAVFMKKSANTAFSDIGILYSANAFMNLDIKTPIDRIGAIIDLIQPALIITDKSQFDKINGESGWGRHQHRFGRTCQGRASIHSLKPMRRQQCVCFIQVIHVHTDNRHIPFQFYYTGNIHMKSIRILHPDGIDILAHAADFFMTLFKTKLFKQLPVFLLLCRNNQWIE